MCTLGSRIVQTNVIRLRWGSLKEIRLDSVDEIWKSIDSGNDLTSAKLQGLIRKSLTIDQLGLYLDSNLSHSSLFVRAGHNYGQ